MGNDSPTTPLLMDWLIVKLETSVLPAREGCGLPPMVVSPASIKEALPTIP